MTVDPKERVRSYAANVCNTSLLQTRNLNSFQKYYQPNASRKNLTVIVSSHVKKIATEMDAGGLATAVEVLFYCEDTPHAVGVGKEVILSAG